VTALGAAAWFGGTAPGPTRAAMDTGVVPLIGWVLLVGATACMVAFITTVCWHWS